MTRLSETLAKRMDRVDGTAIPDGWVIARDDVQDPHQPRLVARVNQFERISDLLSSPTTGDVCSARRLAPRQGHRSPYRRGLRSRLERLGDIHFAHAKTIVLVQPENIRHFE